MRRMYSKEQLQKLIDEVSRLIAIEELDKVVPVPSLEKAGYYMQVNAAGNGYQLVQVPSTPLYCHPVTIYDVSNEDTSKRFFATCLIFNNSATAFTKASFFAFVKELIRGSGARIMLSGGGFSHNTKGNLILSALFYDNTNSWFAFEGWRTADTYDAKTLLEADLEASSINVLDGVNQLL